MLMPGWMRIESGGDVGGGSCNMQYASQIDAWSLCNNTKEKNQTRFTIHCIRYGQTLLSEMENNVDDWVFVYA